VYYESNNSFTLYDVTNLDSFESIGKLYINSYKKGKHFKVESEKLDYKVVYEPKFKVKLMGDADISFLHNNFELKDFKLDVVDSYVDITTNVKDAFDSDFTIYNKTDITNEISYGDIYINDLQYDDILSLNAQKLAYSITHEPLQVKVDGSLNTLLKDKKILFDNITLNLKNDLVAIASKIMDNKHSLTINTVTDLNTKRSQGDVTIHKFKYQHYIDLVNEQLSYNLDFNNSILLDIPEYGLEYKKEGKKQTVLIENPNKILANVKHIKSNNDNARIKFYSDSNFRFTNMIVNNFALDINSNILGEKSKKDSSIKYPTVNTWIYNSTFKYDDFELAVDTVEAKSLDNKLVVDFIPKGEKSAIKFSMVDKNYTIHSKKVSDNFINKILRKRWFEEGNFELHLNGDFNNLKGTVLMEKTNVRDMYVLNNLITFVNTTPAIINPILALPTLFRLGETDFNLGGYPVKHGYIQMNYDINKKHVTLHDVYTSSKMTDFKANGYIDILNEKLKFKVDVIFLKDFSKFLNHIPVVGYIFTGDGGNFITEVDVEGDFKEQDFETHAVKNASDGALGVIKRTLSLPLLPFMGETSEKDKEEHEKRVKEILFNESKNNE
jgi:hypothetical protein